MATTSSATTTCSSGGGGRCRSGRCTPRSAGWLATARLSSARSRPARGRTGSGTSSPSSAPPRSTLLHCLAGILTPDAGEIRFEGRRIDTLNEQERSALRRERFGFVFQFGQLVPELTVEENVALPLLLGGVRRGEALRQARDWLERLGLGGLERRRSGELSGGQAQ